MAAVTSCENVLFKNFHSAQRIEKDADSYSDYCGQKPNPQRKVADSKIFGYVWRGPECTIVQLFHILAL